MPRWHPGGDSRRASAPQRYIESSPRAPDSPAAAGPLPRARRRGLAPAPGRRPPGSGAPSIRGPGSRAGPPQERTRQERMQRRLPDFGPSAVDAALRAARETVLPCAVLPGAPVLLRRRPVPDCRHRRYASFASVSVAGVLFTDIEAAGCQVPGGLKSNSPFSVSGCGPNQFGDRVVAERAANHSRRRTNADSVVLALLFWRDVLFDRLVGNEQGVPP